MSCVGIFFFKQKTAYEMLRSLVGSEMCIRDRRQTAFSDFSVCRLNVTAKNNVKSEKNALIKNCDSGVCEIGLSVRKGCHTERSNPDVRKYQSARYQRNAQNVER